MSAREYDRKNPTVENASTGVSTNHSTKQRSVATAANAQSNDSVNDIPVANDPNISGNAPTQTPYTWLAGKMDGWRENDDYRMYFEQSRGCDGMLVCDPNDGDYDDNGGYPPAVGHARGEHGAEGSTTLGARTIAAPTGSPAFIWVLYELRQVYHEDPEAAAYSRSSPLGSQWRPRAYQHCQAWPGYGG